MALCRADTDPAVRTFVGEQCEPEFVNPLALVGFTITGGDFNQVSPEADYVCNLSSAPDIITGFVVDGNCYNPTVSNPEMTWNNADFVEWEFGLVGGASPDGAVELRFSTPSSGTWTWPFNQFGMVVGEQRLSNVAPDASRLRVTYLSGPSGGNNAPRMPNEFFPGTQIVLIHGANNSKLPPIRIRLERVS